MLPIGHHKNHMAFTHIDRLLFETLTKEAKAASRKRKNFNFHKSADEPVQRMLNALEPETYARPHRHLGKPEVFLCLQGRALMVGFDKNGKIVEHVLISPHGPIFGVDVAEGMWHTVIALDPGTILYEVEQGPYDPKAAKEFAAWTPTEEGGEGQTFNAKLLDQLKIS